MGRHAGRPRHKQQTSMIRRYVIWRNNHIIWRNNHAYRRGQAPAFRPRKASSTAPITFIP
jgi:hypothetical protein